MNENIYDPVEFVLGHYELFGNSVSIEEIKKIISKYSITSWLDFLTRIECVLVINHKGIDVPQKYLAKIIFPKSTLCRINRHARKNDLFFTLGQVNLTRKFAIAYGQNSVNYENKSIFDNLRSAEISRVFLGVQDLFNQYDDEECIGSGEENFQKFVIRNGYLFGHQIIDIRYFLGRSYEMYVVHGKNEPFLYYSNFSDFLQQEIGISIEQFMTLVSALFIPLYGDEMKIAEGPFVIDPQIYFKNTNVEKKVINAVIGELEIDVLKLREKLLIELNDVDFNKKPVGYNLDTFRKSPLARLSDGRLAYLNIACLLEKASQNLVWLANKRELCSIEVKHDTLVNNLANFRGEIFHKYIRSLCERIGNNDNRMTFCYFSAKDTEDNEEISDGILIQGNKIILIEAKSRQFNEKFKYSGDFISDEKFLLELTDEAPKQLHNNGEKILKGHVNKFPINPQNIERIFPVILTYESIPLHGKIKKYIRKKVEKNNYLTNQKYAPMEIITVDELEQFMSLSIDNTLIEILEEKLESDEHASETSFRNFLSVYCSKNNITSNNLKNMEFENFIIKIMKPNLSFKDK